MISVEGLEKRYGAIEALGGLALSVSRGEILAVVGPCGCGKTTLLRILAGLESPDSGRVLIDGIEVSSPSRTVAPHKRRLSMVFQDLALWPHMTVREHIEFILEKDKLPRRVLRVEAKKTLEGVNLFGQIDRYPHALSGGEKQRLAIARALASRPEYLLMDEPFSNLDPLLRGDLQSFLVNLKDRFQMGILYVTHRIREALAVADWIAIMNEGRLEQIDRKEALLANPRNEFVRRYASME